MSVSGVVEQFPYLGLFLLLILGGIGFPFPEDTTLILCGFLISHDIVEPVPAIAVVYSGLLMTDFFLYLIGKKYGRAVILHKRFSKFISPGKISFIEDKFRKRGILVILLGRHFLGLRAPIFVVAGIMKMSALKFLVADSVTSIFTIALMAGAGYMGGYSLQVIKRGITRIEHVAILLLVVSLAIYLLFRYFKSRKE